MPKSLLNSKELKELLATERSYNESLTIFKDALSTAVGHFSGRLSESINTLHDVSNAIIDNLERTLTLLKKTSEIEELSPKDTQERLKLGFKRLNLISRFFKEYSEYSILFTEIGEARKKNPTMFDELARNIHKIYRGGFDSLLIQPIQRGPRYKLLLEALNKYVTKYPESVDERQRDMIEGLLEEVTGLLKKANESTPKPSEKKRGYKFGDLTRYYILGTHPEQKKPSEESAFELLDFDEPEESEKDAGKEVIELSSTDSVELETAEAETAGGVKEEPKASSSGTKGWFGFSLWGTSSSEKSSSEEESSLTNTGKRNL